MEKCIKCIYLRRGNPLDPLEGIRLLSSKVLELRAKWHQEIEKRSFNEEQMIDQNAEFNFEPITTPYCLRFSRLDPAPGEEPVYQLCYYANRDNTCKDFTPAEESPDEA